MWKDMDFSLLLKTWAEAWVLSNTYGVKNFLIVLKNLQQMQKKKKKTASKRAIQKTAEVTGDLIGNNIVDKITSVSKRPAKKLPNNDETKEDEEITTHKKWNISSEKRQQIIDKLRLVPKNYWWTDANTIVRV